MTETQNTYGTLKENKDEIIYRRSLLVNFIESLPDPERQRYEILIHPRKVKSVAEYQAYMKESEQLIAELREKSNGLLLQEENRVKLFD